MESRKLGFFGLEKRGSNLFFGDLYDENKRMMRKTKNISAKYGDKSRTMNLTKPVIGDTITFKIVPHDFHFFKSSS